MKDEYLSDLRALIEKGRAARLLSNDVAMVLSETLKLSPDDAILANRILCQGSDPFSIQMVYQGSVEPSVRQAHMEGPGKLKGADKWEWLKLAALSADDSKAQEFTLTERIRQFAWTQWALEFDPSSKLRQRAEEELEKIMNLPFVLERHAPDAQLMRVYNSDRGFAAAYWAGEEFAAVRSPDGTMFIASQGRTLKELGILVNKEITPCFGIR